MSQSDEKTSKKEAADKGSPFIFQYPPLDVIYLDLSDRPNWDKFAAFINEKRHTVKDSDISYRILNHWTAEGLLADDREQAGGWRKLSLKDLIWVRLLSELRGFGLPLEKLRQTYKTFNPDTLDFEVAVALCLQTPPAAVFVAVFEDGSAQAATMQCLRATDYLVGYENTYIRISLNAICHHVSGKRHAMPPRTSAVELHDAELQVIGTLREKGVGDIRLRLRDGALDEIETTHKVDSKSRLATLLDDVPFGEITIKRDDRKTSHVSVTKKRKVKK